MNRIFPVRLLEEWDFPWGLDILSEEHVEKHRWFEVIGVVFRAPDDGLTYRVYYQRGLTEYQDGHEKFGGDTEVEGAQVELREVTVKRWLPVA